MTLKVLSSSESMSLCRGAADLVLDRFHWLAGRTAPEDHPLTVLFADLAGDVERDLVEIDQLEAQGHPSGAHQQESGRTVARGFLPSLLKTAGEGRLSRESGFYLVECLLEDLAGFYGALVRQSCDKTSRDFLLRAKQTVNGRLDFLHKVVLKGPASASSLENPDLFRIPEGRITSTGGHDQPIVGDYPHGPGQLSFDGPAPPCALPPDGDGLRLALPWTDPSGP